MLDVGYAEYRLAEHHRRSAKLLDSGAGTNQVPRMLIGRELVGAAPAPAQ